MNKLGSRGQVLMRPALMWGIPVAGLVASVVLGYKVSPHNGWWHGTTSQGRALSFLITNNGLGEVIEEIEFQIDLTCEQTNNIVSAEVHSIVPVDIVDRHFSLSLRFLTFWDVWNGSLLNPNEAHGDMAVVWVALNGTDINALSAEKCSAFDVTWGARPGAPYSFQTSDVDVYFDLSRNDFGQVVMQRCNSDVPSVARWSEQCSISRF